MAKLITESNYNVSINEQEEGKKLIIDGVFASAETKNRNGRIYPKSILEREVSNIQEKIKRGSCWGELDHPSQASINSDRIAISIKLLEWRGNDVYGKAVVTDTPCGKILKGLVKDGTVGVSTRGLGTVNEETSYVNEDFNLITIDAVTDPSNYASWVNGIYEAKEFLSEDEKAKKELEKIEEAKKAYTKHIFQVIEYITKTL